MNSCPRTRTQTHTHTHTHTHSFRNEPKWGSCWLKLLCLSQFIFFVGMFECVIVDVAVFRVALAGSVTRAFFCVCFTFCQWFRSGHFLFYHVAAGNVCFVAVAVAPRTVPVARGVVLSGFSCMKCMARLVAEVACSRVAAGQALDSSGALSSDVLSKV